MRRESIYKTFNSMDKRKTNLFKWDIQENGLPMWGEIFLYTKIHNYKNRRMERWKKKC